MCDGKDKLRQRLKEKRVNEGLGDIPDDLFEKKPRHEVSQTKSFKVFDLEFLSCDWAVVKTRFNLFKRMCLNNSILYKTNHNIGHLKNVYSNRIISFVNTEIFLFAFVLFLLISVVKQKKVPV